MDSAGVVDPSKLHQDQALSYCLNKDEHGSANAVRKREGGPDAPPAHVLQLGLL